MARSKSIIRLQDTIAGMTFVSSKVYGDYVRAARGTYKPATMNEACKNESKKLLRANIPAKMMLQALAPYRVDFSGGLLWQRLVSMFRRQIHETGEFDFKKIVPMEIHEQYPLGRFLSIKSTAFQKNASQLNITICYHGVPSFPKAKHIDGYKLTVVCIFPERDKMSLQSASIESLVISLKDESMSFNAVMEVSGDADCFILCVKIEGYMKGVVSDTHATKGMRTLGSFGISK